MAGFTRYHERLRLMNFQLHLNRNITMNTVLMAKLRLEERQERRGKKTPRKPRSSWVRQWIKRRPLLGMFDKLMKELEQEDKKGFKNFMRMTPRLFQEILHRVEKRLTKENRWRKALSPALKLAITLRYLASGDSYHSLMYAFRVAANTISLFILEVCEAILAEFAEELIPCPTTSEEWKNIADLFSERWNFHHCVGALDGKHIAIRCPKNAGSLFFNYKGFH